MSDRMGDSVLTHVDGRPYGMGRKAYVRHIDNKAFRDWVAERNLNAGTEDDDIGAMGFICAQVVGRATLKQISSSYGIDYGLLWDFVNMKPERVDRYRNAQKGMAEWLAGETLEIADEINPETGERDPGSGDSVRDKIRIDQRNKLMKAWNRERYGDSEGVLGSGLENLAAVLQRISERKLSSLSGLQAPNPDITDVEITKEIVDEEVQREEAAEEVLVKPAVSDNEGMYI